MQTLPAAAVFGLLPVPAMPDNASGDLGARSTPTASSEVSRAFGGQPTRPSRLCDHVKALLDGLEERPLHRLHPL
jgi:hypothetical protein